MCFSLTSSQSILVESIAVLVLWFAHDYANYGQFPPDFDMAYQTTQHACNYASVPNSMLFNGPIKTGLWAKEVGEFSVMLYEPTLLPQ